MVADEWGTKGKDPPQRPLHWEEWPMETAAKMTLDEAHLEFAKQANGEVWRLLEKDGRSPDDDRAMVIACVRIALPLVHCRQAGAPSARRMADCPRVHRVGRWSACPDLRRAVLMATTEAHKDQMSTSIWPMLRGPRQSPRSGRPS